MINMTKLSLLAASLLLLAQPALAAPPQEMETTNHGSHSNMASPQKPITTTGTVRLLQKDAVIIKHPPIETLNWPAMTMSFKATPKQLEGLKPGDTVDITFTAQGMEATLVGIERR